MRVGGTDGAGIQHLGDVGMVHHGQRLPLGLEPRDDLLGVHAQLDDLERHAPAHRFSLLRHIHHAATTFAHALQQLVAPQSLAHGFVGRIGEVQFDGGFDGARCRGQRVLRLFVGSKQGFEALAEGAVCPANGLKKC